MRLRYWVRAVPHHGGEVEGGQQVVGKGLRVIDALAKARGALVEDVGFAGHPANFVAGSPHLGGRALTGPGAPGGLLDFKVVVRYERRRRASCALEAGADAEGGTEALEAAGGLELVPADVAGGVLI